MEKGRVKYFLKKYAHNTISYQSMMDGLDHFESSKGIEGFIAYLQIDSVVLAAGDPVCADEQFFEFVHEFRIFCKNNNFDCVFLSVSEHTQHYYELMGFGYLKIGDEGIFDLSSYSFEGKEMKHIRYLIRHARKEGVMVRRFEQRNEKIFAQIEQLSRKWLNSRNVHGFSFLLTLNPLENFEDKIFFIAEKQNKLVGYLSCVPIYLRNGLYFEDLIRDIEAPNGTNHLMVYEAVNYLKAEGYSIATLGSSPLGHIKDTDNPDHRLLNQALEFFYQHPNGFYNFKGLHEFKESFNPTIREDKFICYFPPKLKIRVIIALLKAYNPAGVSDLVLSKLKKIMENE